MKRLLGVIMIVILCSTGITACQETTGTTGEESSAEQNEQEAATEQTDQTDQTEQQEEGSNDDETAVPPPGDVSEMEPVKINVYYSNEDGDGFEVAETKVQTLSPDEILRSLAAYEMIPADLGFESCSTETVNGKVMVDLDMTKEFGEYLVNMGTSGEYMVLGSVVNTFLDAYEAEVIRITVDGQTLETGHAEYPNYLSRFTQP